MAVRSLQADRFAAKGKWTTTVCIGVIAFLTLLTWMPTVAWPMYNRCFASLIWFPMRYELLMLVILSALVGMFLILAAIISIQLMRTSDVDPNQRIAASRTCYYLIMGALLYVSFWFKMGLGRKLTVTRLWSSLLKCKLIAKISPKLTLRRGSPKSLYSPPVSFLPLSTCSCVSTPLALSSRLSTRWIRNRGKSGLNFDCSDPAIWR